MTSYATDLRREICQLSKAFAMANSLPHVESYGQPPVVVYEPISGGEIHGNFLPASYRAIIRRPDWHRRLNKVHTAVSRSLPRADRCWCELDSCCSSDALLMNVFCHPSSSKNKALHLLLGTEPQAPMEFGFRARVPFAGHTDTTEVDLRIGDLLVEAKLTESDFQDQQQDRLTKYRDLEAVFAVDALPRNRERFRGYQLIRNVLAASAHGCSFCVLLDARRPDLMEQWFAIMTCVRPVALRCRCKVLTWQELTCVLPLPLQRFLRSKYGIAAAPGEVTRLYLHANSTT